MAALGSSLASAMRQRRSGLSTDGLNGHCKEDQKPTSASLEYTVTFHYVLYNYNTVDARCVTNATAELVPRVSKNRTFCP